MARGPNSGRALTRRDIPDKVVPRFWVKVDRFHPSGCWTWTGAHCPDGSGMMGWSTENGPVNHAAHRVAYVLQHRNIPAGLVVRSTCGRRDCVHPDHLQLGVHGDRRGRSWGLSFADVNIMRAKIKSGCTDDALAAELGISRARVGAIRLNYVWFDPDYVPIRYGHGESAHSAKLTAEDVIRARSLAGQGVRMTELARQFGTAASTMWDAVRGVTWVHLAGAVPAAVRTEAASSSSQSDTQ